MKMGLFSLPCLVTEFWQTADAAVALCVLGTIGVLAQEGGGENLTRWPDKSVVASLESTKFFCERDGAICVGLVGGEFVLMPRRARPFASRCAASREEFCVDLSWGNKSSLHDSLTL